jgi:hypothetical protein
VNEHQALLLDAARRHGKDVAMLFGTAAEARPWIEAGIRIIAIDSDVAVLQNGYRDIVAGLRAGIDGHGDDCSGPASNVMGFEHARSRAQ